MRISILQSSATGTVAYSETKAQLPILMVVSLEIGSGIPVTGTLQALIGQTVLTL
jgi:hypothetical protein